MIYTNVNYDMSGRKRKKAKVRGEVYKKYTPPSFQKYVPKPVYRRETVYDTAPSNNMGSGQTPKIESIKYTGTLIKGIATMHKSNAVPVIDEQHAKDISSMRR